MLSRAGGVVSLSQEGFLGSSKPLALNRIDKSLPKEDLINVTML